MTQQQQQQHEYKKVSEIDIYSVDESTDDNTIPPPSQQPFWKKPTLLISLTVLSILTAILTTITTHTPTFFFNTNATTSILSCGTTPSSARAQNCIYDVMMQLWTPAPCYDATLTTRFLSANNWTWYADPGATTSYSDAEIALGEHDVVYVGQDYHKTHCIFAGEKLVRALRTQRPLIEQLMSYDHAVHCRMRALEVEEGEGGRGAVAPTGYARCAMYDVWLREGNLVTEKHSSVD